MDTIKYTNSAPNDELFSHVNNIIYITGSLTEAIIAQHSSLRGIARQLAEVYYIVGAQQLDGYGQECFLAKGQLILKCPSNLQCRPKPCKT